MIRQFEFVLKNFFLFHKPEEKATGIQYGQLGKGKVKIKQSADEKFFGSFKDINSKDVIWKKWKSRSIPLCFDSSDEDDMFTEENGNLTINYDIIASAFYFLSGWNEFVSGKNDELGRITYEGSIIKELGIINFPVVNYYFDILKTAIERAYNTKVKDNLWSKNEFAVALTHDIDNCMSAWLEGSFSEIKKGRIFSVPGLILKRVFSKDEWFNFDLISEIEKEFDSTSTYYFLPGKGKSGKFANADYDISSAEIQSVIKTLSDKGNEIGVHGSFGSHMDKELLMDDIRRVNRKDLKGNRFHFLMFDLKKTTGVLEDSGIKYDSSLGFSDQTGFRRGTCLPFYIYDFHKNRISDVIEIPLIVMDAALRNSMKYKPSDEKLFSELEVLMEETRKFHGVLTILWHNNYFSDYKYKGWKDVYINILKACKEKNALIISAGKIHKIMADNDKYSDQTL
jgi:hypothetical protein